jgi:hypothetical protein
MPDAVEPVLTPTARAETLTRQKAIDGCFSGFFLGAFSGKFKSAASMLVEIAGGRVGPPGNRIRGGNVADFQLESSRHPVGLLFC